MTFHASPSFRCHAPGRTFADVEQAVAYARDAAERFNVPFAVWAIQAGRPHLVRRFIPTAHHHYEDSHER
jgi:hypothetical protein